MVKRGLTSAVLEKAIDNTERVLATVISNSSKNVTNAQAMKGNASALAQDLRTLMDVRQEFLELEMSERLSKKSTNDTEDTIEVKEEPKEEPKEDPKTKEETKPRAGKSGNKEVKAIPPSTDEV